MAGADYLKCEICAERIMFEPDADPEIKVVCMDCYHKATISAPGNKAKPEWCDECGWVIPHLKDCGAKEKKTWLDDPCINNACWYYCRNSQYPNIIN